MLELEFNKRGNTSSEDRFHLLNHYLADFDISVKTRISTLTAVNVKNPKMVTTIRLARFIFLVRLELRSPESAQPPLPYESHI